jgi:hypothetical protein
MKIIRTIEVEVTKCGACEERLGLNREVGIFHTEGNIIALCVNCSKQIDDLLSMLAMGAGFLKDETRAYGGENDKH